MFTLNDAQTDADILHLTDMFESAGFEIRVVGGAVRDHLMGQVPKDVDLCTNATPGEMIEIAKENNIHMIPTGLQHGTVTFMMTSGGYEITTLRIDVETDGRHAQVEFTKDFQLDASRRDFTINAMSLNPRTGEVFDYFGGQQDIKTGMVRFVGRAEDRIAEDFLRVLRWFRFTAKMNSLTIDQEIMNLFSADWVHAGLEKISGERIWAEFKKILDYRSAALIFDKMIQLGLMPSMTNIGMTYRTEMCKEDHRINVTPMVKKFCNNRFDHLETLDRCGMVELSKVGALSVLAMHDAFIAPHAMPWQEVIALVDDRLKLSAEERKAIEFTWERYLRFGPDGYGVPQRMVSTPIYNWVTLARLAGSNARSAVVDRLVHGRKTEINDPFDTTLVRPMNEFFDVTGFDLTQRGMKPGPSMGIMLKILRTKMIDGPKPWSKKDLLAWVDNLPVPLSQMHIMVVDMLSSNQTHDIAEWCKEQGVQVVTAQFISALERPYQHAIICESEEAAVVLKLRMDW